MQLLCLLCFYCDDVFFISLKEAGKGNARDVILNTNGDNITTIGGICGKVVGIRDDILTIEVGRDKVNLVIERWAVRDVDKPISAD